MRGGYAMGCALVLMAGLSPAQAQDDAERYQLQRTPDGYVRLDTSNGRMALCQERNGQLVCRMATEERAAYDRDLEGLQDRVDALEARIAALEGGNAAGLTSEEEFEQTLGYMERFFRRFMGIVRDFEREGNDAPPADPDRT